MDPYEVFKEECRENIDKQGKDHDLKGLSLEFIKKSHKHKYSYNFSWMGRPIIQYPQDMIMMQELIWNLKPELIIETGVAHGGSIIFYASILELIGSGEVLGVDIDIRPHNRLKIEEHTMSKRIKLLEGSSVDEKILKEVKKIAENKKRILVCLDSNHTHEHVLSELNMYSDLVTKGSYLVVFDTIIEHASSEFSVDRPWGKGNSPASAVADFLKNRNDFEVDHRIDDKILISVSPSGYLRKK